MAHGWSQLLVLSTPTSPSATKPGRPRHRCPSAAPGGGCRIGDTQCPCLRSVTFTRLTDVSTEVGDELLLGQGQRQRIRVTGLGGTIRITVDPVLANRFNSHSG